MVNVVKININDKFRCYEDGIKRLKIILELLGLRPLKNWEKSPDRTHVSQKFVETWECDYESPYSVEELKLIMKAVELAEIPPELKEKISADFKLNNIDYVKLCDIDVLFKTGFFIFSTWEKVYTRLIAKKLCLDDQELLKVCLQKWKKILETVPKDIIEQIKKVEYKILSTRIK
jgi:hypothetical protein